MKQQNLKNHIRFHPAYHFVSVPLLFLLIIASIVYLITTFNSGESTWLAILVLISAVFLIITITLAREYSKKVQDRVIRLEENFRHYRIVGVPLQSELTLSQIIALRFASDSEFPALCARAAKEKLTSREIKESIKEWRADLLRV